jgi:hypothetical protein
MMYFALALGCLMFVHFGCAILKHDANRSDLFLKGILLAKLICSVLVIRASSNNDYWDLLIALLINASINMAFALYTWAHGITFLDIGKHMH